MTVNQIEYKYIDGKTYSLFAKDSSLEAYFHTIADITDNILNEGITLKTALKLIQTESRKSDRMKRMLSSGNKSKLHSTLELNREPLYIFTRNVKKHLKELPVLKFWDRRLATTERQYHLYMIEIELTNRLNRESFSRSTWKIALLPHCLREFDHDCKASQGDFDIECKNCSKTCFIGRVSKILRTHRTEPYIWMGSDLKSLKSIATQRMKRPAVLGIACIPELVAGMRKCHRLDLPAVGIPLNANRCIRWMGKFYENSVYIEKLEELLI